MTDAPTEAPTMPRHTCFLVEDLEASIESFTAISGTAFDAIREVPMRMAGSAGDELDVVRFAYSLDGTLELVARGARGMFGPDVPAGLHHIGHLLDVDLDVAIKREQARGERLEWNAYLGDFMMAAYFEPTVERPVRVEVISPDIMAKAGPQ